MFFFASAQKATINSAILVFLSRQARGRKSDIDKKIDKGRWGREASKSLGGGGRMRLLCLVVDNQPRGTPSSLPRGFSSLIISFYFQIFHYVQMFKSYSSVVENNIVLGALLSSASIPWSPFVLRGGASQRYEQIEIQRRKTRKSSKRNENRIQHDQ